MRWNLFQEAGSPLDWSSINYSARVDKNPFTHSTFTPTDDLRVLGEPNMNVFGMWVESGVCGDEPSEREENMETPDTRSPNP